MCNFTTPRFVELEGSGKAAGDWFTLGRAQVYHDHFVEANLEGGVVVDLVQDAATGKLQVCLELSAEAARALGQALLDTVKEIPGANPTVAMPVSTTA